MDSSTLNREQTDPQNVFARVHEEIARAYEQIAVADKQIARTLAQDAARHPPAAVNNVQVPVDRPSFGRPAVRGFVGVLLAACIGVAAIAWQSNGDAAKQMIARWAPQLDLNSSPAPESPVPAQPSPPAVQAAAAKATPPQPAPPAQTAPEPPGQAQLLQSTARDRAAAEQDIEQLRASIEQLKTSQEQMVRDNAALAGQLKASQEQMARDNAALADQLKASQEQMARLIAKASEQNLRPKTSVPRPQPIAIPTRKPAPKPSSPQETSAPPPWPIATPTRKPVPKPSSPQARAQPQDPMQGRPEQQ